MKCSKLFIKHNPSLYYLYTVCYKPKSPKGHPKLNMKFQIADRNIF